jgi:hypothetical protein
LRKGFALGGIGSLAIEFLATLRRSQVVLAVFGMELARIEVSVVQGTVVVALTCFIFPFTAITPPSRTSCFSVSSTIVVKVTLSVAEIVVALFGMLSTSIGISIVLGAVVVALTFATVPFAFTKITRMCKAFCFIELCTVMIYVTFCSGRIIVARAMKVAVIVAFPGFIVVQTAVIPAFSCIPRAVWYAVTRLCT